MLLLTRVINYFSTKSQPSHLHELSLKESSQLFECITTCELWLWTLVSFTEICWITWMMECLCMIKLGGGIHLFSISYLIHLILVNKIYEKGFIYLFKSVQTWKQKSNGLSNQKKNRRSQLFKTEELPSHICSYI